MHLTIIHRFIELILYLYTVSFEITPLFKMSYFVRVFSLHTYDRIRLRNWLQLKIYILKNGKHVRRYSPSHIACLDHQNIHITCDSKVLRKWYHFGGSLIFPAICCTFIPLLHFLLPLLLPLPPPLLPLPPLLLGPVPSSLARSWLSSWLYWTTW